MIYKFIALGIIMLLLIISYSLLVMVHEADERAERTEPQGIVLPRKGCHRPIELPCHSEQGDGYCANCIYWHEDFEGVAYGKTQTERSE